MKRVVLDASVILKWYLPDEEQGEEALDLLKRYISDDMEIIAPSLLEYEVINGLMVARKRARLSDDAILSAIEGFGNLGIRLLGFSGQYARLIYSAIPPAAPRTMPVSFRGRLEKIPFITADEALQKAVKKDLHWVKRLGES